MAGVVGDLLLSAGDEEIHGTCVCGKHLASIRPDGDLLMLIQAWMRHITARHPEYPEGL